MDSSFQQYERALGLWRARRFAEARTVLEGAWRATGRRSIFGTLLMGYILRDSQQYVSEIEWLRRLVKEFAAAPEREQLADAWSLLGSAYRTLGLAREAVVALLRSAEIEPRPRQKLIECSNAVFAANAAPVAAYGAAEMQRLYARYRELLQDYMASLGAVPYGRPEWRHEQIRVGYISADLHEHPVAQYVRSLLTRYDADAFRVYVYDIGRTHDAVTAALQRPEAVWREAAKLTEAGDFAGLAAQIRADEIDVLVDLAGHTSGNALPVFGWRAAPVQISGLGYFNSTGLYETTGFLSDVYCAPEAESPYFVEPLLRLPHSHFCYEPYSEFPEPGAPPCLARGYVAFGCFNNFAKLTDEMLRLWGRILAAVPTARLVLKHKLFDSAEGLAYTRERFARLGLPLERIELRGFSHDYLAEYREIDIALDPSPYPGGATTCEALYMGVPVVTLVGDRHGARFGYSFLANIGLAELAAPTPERYVEFAVGLAQDAELLCALHVGLRGLMQHSPLMDGQQYVRDVEELYRRLVVQARSRISDD